MSDKLPNETIKYEAGHTRFSSTMSALESATRATDDSVDMLSIHVVYVCPDGRLDPARVPAYAVIGGGVFELKYVPEATQE